MELGCLEDLPVQCGKSVGGVGGASMHADAGVELANTCRVSCLNVAKLCY